MLAGERSLQSKVWQKAMLRSTPRSCDRVQGAQPVWFKLRKAVLKPVKPSFAIRQLYIFHALRLLADFCAQGNAAKAAKAAYHLPSI